MRAVNEYVIMFNPDFPNAQYLDELGVYDDIHTAGKELIRLLNLTYPGKWTPESIGSASLRFAHTESVGAALLLGCVRSRIASLDVLIHNRDRLIKDLRDYTNTVERLKRELAEADIMIAVLSLNKKS